MSPENWGKAMEVYLNDPSKAQINLQGGKDEGRVVIVSSAYGKGWGRVARSKGAS